MSACVVDASIAAKWFLHEEHSHVARAVLSGGYELHAPDFFLLEMDSILCKWIRRGLITVAESRIARTAIRQAPIRIHPFAGLQESAYAIATDSGCTIYDCLYVALAVLLDGRMVTADRRLYDGLAQGPLRTRVLWVGDIP